MDKDDKTIREPFEPTPHCDVHAEFERACPSCCGALLGCVHAHMETVLTSDEGREKLAMDIAQEYGVPLTDAAESYKLWARIASRRVFEDFAPEKRPLARLEVAMNILQNTMPLLAGMGVVGKVAFKACGKAMTQLADAVFACRRQEEAEAAAIGDAQGPPPKRKAV